MPRPTLVAIVGPTATGKSALGIALAHRFGGEVVSCDSTAVYRGFDIGTDKVPFADRQGIPHHMIDVADPLEEYSAARYAREASAIIRDITGRGRLPILVGGTGLYYRALTRGFFPGPAPRHGASGAARADRGSQGRGAPPRAASSGRSRIGRAHLGRGSQARDSRAGGLPPDRASADRAFRRTLDRRCRTTTSSRLRCGFRRTRPTRGWPARVDAQFRQGLLDEIRRCWLSGIPETAHPFTGLVYRQAIEHLRGVRDEAATRELIVQENRKYSRRQLIWFRKEPNLHWIHAAGEREETQEQVARALAPTRRN